MISCHDVIKIYTDPVTNLKIAALRGIDLTISRGELISIIGPSGSGKTTLIKILAGIETISSGNVIIDSHELGKMTPEELLSFRLNNIGLVHQFPERTLFLSGTVMDNLTFASSLYSTNLSENKQRNQQILKRLGIDHLANRRVSYLSGGEMIRTSVACALAKNAPVLLCDEPTGQLDTANTEIIKELLKELSDDFGITVLVVTHDLSFLKGVDRTCEIHSGRVSALYRANTNMLNGGQEFPLRFRAHIDSSQSVRIPNRIYNIMQLKNEVDFLVSEDSEVEIQHPEGLPPKKIEIKEQKKQKILEIKSLPDSYFANKEFDITIKEASKIYGSGPVKVDALTDITLDIFQGEFAFVIGPSGSGKTTLIKLITGMEASTNGQISVLGHNLHQLNDSERAEFRRKNIGIVSQQGGLHPYITVQENLFLKDIFSGRNFSFSERPKNQIEELFEMFQINHRKDSYPLEVSGGELQRASLAIAQFGAPKILIFDEPTANMDSELAEGVMDRLYNLQEQLNVTMLISTHDIDLVRDGTRVIELKDGKIHASGLGKALEI
ncbi:MAG: ATP-binding cassette domain-containing protein [Candidatus Heimdallarchaeota archaeon]|nr:ATP-binding cassette domain-containing protein [Candidatus Heimdallarchaeota archaeon]